MLNFKTDYSYMKKNYYLHRILLALIIILFIAPLNPAKAQWKKASISDLGMVKTLKSRDSIIIAGTDTGGVYLSTNFGASWIEKNIGITNKNVNAVIIKDTVTILGVGGFGSAIYVSTNKGDSWFTPTSPYSGFLYCMVEQGNNILAGTWFGVAKSTDNGDTWGSLPIAGLPSNASVTALFAKGDTIFAGVSSSSVGGEGIFRSTNNGDTWVKKSTGITGSDFTGVAQSGNTLIATTKGGGGVYTSINNGDSWSIANSGLNNVSVNCLFVRGNNVLIGTGNGIFSSTNNAASWGAINTGLAANTRVLSIANNGHFLLIGTDSTIWRRPTIEVITGIKTVKNNGAVNIYPNPSNGIFMLELLGNTNAQQVSISNAIGQVVYINNSIGNNTLQLNVDNVAKGVYTIQITTAQGVVNKKIIIE